VLALQRSLETIAAGVRAEWGIFVKFLDSDEEVAINAETPMDTMSVIKVPLLLELYRQVGAGTVDLDRRLTLGDEDRRFGTGVLALLDPGLTLSLRDAATLMIVQSDNVATDLCFDAVGGPDAVNRLMEGLGLHSIQALGTAFEWFRELAATMDASLATLSPAALYATGYPPQTPDERIEARAAYHFGGGRPFGLATAADLGRLLERIWRGSAADGAACEQVLRIMRLQQHRARMPRYLIGATCAHKTGDFEPFIANDVGIIEPYGAPPAIAVFLNSRHRGLWANLEEAVARMAEKVWERALSLAD